MAEMPESSSSSTSTLSSSTAATTTTTTVSSSIIITTDQHQNVIDVNDQNNCEIIQISENHLNDDINDCNDDNVEKFCDNNQQQQRKNSNISTAIKSMNDNNDNDGNIPPDLLTSNSATKSNAMDIDPPRQIANENCLITRTNAVTIEPNSDRLIKIANEIEQICLDDNLEIASITLGENDFIFEDNNNVQFDSDHKFLDTHHQSPKNSLTTVNDQQQSSRQDLDELNESKFTMLKNDNNQELHDSRQNQSHNYHHTSISSMISSSSSSLSLSCASKTTTLSLTPPPPLLNVNYSSNNNNNDNDHMTSNPMPSTSLISSSISKNSCQLSSQSLSLENEKIDTDKVMNEEYSANLPSSSSSTTTTTTTTTALNNNNDYNQQIDTKLLNNTNNIVDTINIINNNNNIGEEKILQTCADDEQQTSIVEIISDEYFIENDEQIIMNVINDNDDDGNGDGGDNNVDIDSKIEENDGKNENPDDDNMPLSSSDNDVEIALSTAIIKNDDDDIIDDNNIVDNNNHHHDHHRIQVNHDQMIDSDIDELLNRKASVDLFENIKFSLCESVANSDKIKKIMVGHGAKFLNYLSDSVTYLIANDFDHPMVSEAIDIYEKPVITSQWVWLSLRANRKLPIEPFILNDNENNMNRLFSKVIACTSQISLNDLKHLWSMLTYYGGKFQLHLDDKCTHLLTSKISGKKYEIATKELMGRIHIVTPDWIVDSIKQKKLCQEKRYHPRLLIDYHQNIQGKNLLKNLKSNNNTTNINHSSTKSDQQQQQQQQQESDHIKMPTTKSVTMSISTEAVVTAKKSSADVPPTVTNPNIDSHSFTSPTSISSSSSPPSSLSQPVKPSFVPASTSSTVPHHHSQILQTTNTQSLLASQQQQYHSQQPIRSQTMFNSNVQTTQQHTQRMPLQHNQQQQQQQIRQPIQVVNNNMTQQQNISQQQQSEIGPISQQQQQQQQQMISMNQPGANYQHPRQQYPMQNQSPGQQQPYMQQQPSSAMYQQQTPQQNYRGQFGPQQQIMPQRMMSPTGMPQQQQQQYRLQQQPSTPFTTNNQQQQQQQFRPRQAIPKQQPQQQYISRPQQMITGGPPQQQQQQYLMNSNQLQKLPNQQPQQQQPMVRMIQTPQHPQQQQQQFSNQPNFVDNRQQQSTNISMNSSQIPNQQRMPMLRISVPQPQQQIMNNNSQQSPSHSACQSPSGGSSGGPNMMNYVQPNKPLMRPGMMMSNNTNGGLPQQQQLSQQIRPHQMMMRPMQQYPQQGSMGPTGQTMQPMPARPPQAPTPMNQQQQPMNPQQIQLMRQQQQQRWPQPDYNQQQQQQQQYPRPQVLPPVTPQQQQQAQQQTWIRSPIQSSQRFPIQSQQQQHMTAGQMIRMVVKNVPPNPSNNQPQPQQFYDQSMMMNNKMNQSPIHQPTDQSMLHNQLHSGQPQQQQSSPSMMSSQQQRPIIHMSQRYPHPPVHHHMPPSQHSPIRGTIPGKSGNTFQHSPASSSPITPGNNGSTPSTPSPTSAGIHHLSGYQYPINTPNPPSLYNSSMNNLNRTLSPMQSLNQSQHLQHPNVQTGPMSANHHNHHMMPTHPHSPHHLGQMRQVFGPNQHHMSQQHSPHPHHQPHMQSYPHPNRTMVPFHPLHQQSPSQHHHHSPSSIQHSIAMRFYGHEQHQQGSVIGAKSCLIGCSFYISISYAENDLTSNLTKGWKRRIEKFGGKVVDDLSDARITHVITEHLNLPMRPSNCHYQQMLPQFNSDHRYVSIFWLNDILELGKLLPPWRFYHLPVAFNSHAKPCKHHVISVTNFSQEERSMLKHLINRTGARYTDYLTQKNTILICKKPEGEKYLKAIEWRLAVVNITWLQDLLFGNGDCLSLNNLPKRYRVFNNHQNNNNKTTTSNKMNNGKDKDHNDLMKHNNKQQKFDIFKLDYTISQGLMSSWRTPIRYDENDLLKHVEMIKQMEEMKKKKLKNQKSIENSEQPTASESDNNKISNNIKINGLIDSKQISTDNNDNIPRGIKRSLENGNDYNNDGNSSLINGDDHHSMIVDNLDDNSNISTKRFKVDNVDSSNNNDEDDDSEDAQKVVKEVIMSSLDNILANTELDELINNHDENSSLTNDSFYGSSTASNNGGNHSSTAMTTSTINMANGTNSDSSNNSSNINDLSVDEIAVLSSPSTLPNDNQKFKVPMDVVVDQQKVQLKLKQQLRPSNKYYILLIGLLRKSKQHEHYKKIIENLGGHLVQQSDDCFKATHLVIGSEWNRTLLPKISINFLCSFARTQYIVNIEWLDQSSKAEHFLSEQQFEYVHTDSNDQNSINNDDQQVAKINHVEDQASNSSSSSLSSASSSSSSSSASLVLENYQIDLCKSWQRRRIDLFNDILCILTPSIIPAPPILKQIIEANGGQAVLKQMPNRRQLMHLLEPNLNDGQKSPSKISIITCETDIHLIADYMIDHPDVEIVNTNFIIDSILKQNIDFKPFRLLQSSDTASSSSNDDNKTINAAANVENHQRISSPSNSSKSTTLIADTKDTNNNIHHQSSLNRIVSAATTTNNTNMMMTTTTTTTTTLTLTK